LQDVVKYTGIKGYVADENIAIDWSVSSELNISKYIIERSTNGVSFDVVGSQNSIGNHTNAASYTWFDVNPASGTYTYRVKCVSTTGAFTYSNQVKVQIVKKGAGMYVFPNPVTDNNIGLQLTKIAKGTYTVVLKTKAGQIIHTSIINHAGGSALYTITPINSLVSGQYILEVIGHNKSITILKVLAQTN
jgi:hypothetical protein